MPVDTTERYERHRIVDPSICVPGSFRTHDMGRAGFSKRIACVSKKTGKFITQSMLISHSEPSEMKRKLRAGVSAMKRRARGVYKWRGRR